MDNDRLTLTMKQTTEYCENLVDEIRHQLEAKTGQEWRVFYQPEHITPLAIQMFTCDYTRSSGYLPISELMLDPSWVRLLVDATVHRFFNRYGTGLEKSGKEQWEWAKSFDGKRMEAC